MKNNNIEKLDENFARVEINGVKLLFRNYDVPPFALSGFGWFNDDHELCRLPVSVPPEISPRMEVLARHTAGGMLRFRSDSGNIVLRAELSSIPEMVHMPHSGSSGFDFYLGKGKGKKFSGIARPVNNTNQFEACLVSGFPREMREWTIYFPLYNGLLSLSIGLAPDATVMPPTPFAVTAPLVFYGSSITQGGCASRPSNCYCAHIARWLDANHINLGFSGNAKGEPKIAETIADLDMSVFIMDYDHNAAGVAELKATYAPFIDIIRKKRPDLPIIMVSRPDVDNKMEQSLERTEVIRSVYEKRRRQGDAKVWFVDGSILFGRRNREVCTVDGCHPNDIGFLRMAEHLYPAVKAALSGK